MESMRPNHEPIIPEKLSKKIKKLLAGGLISVLASSAARGETGHSRTVSARNHEEPKTSVQVSQDKQESDAVPIEGAYLVRAKSNTADITAINIRSLPSINSPVLTTVENGGTFYVRDVDGNSVWKQVFFPGSDSRELNGLKIADGFVHGSVIEPVDDEESEPQTVASAGESSTDSGDSDSNEDDQMRPPEPPEQGESNSTETTSIGGEGPELTNTPVPGSNFEGTQEAYLAVKDSLMAAFGPDFDYVKPNTANVYEGIGLYDVTVAVKEISNQPYVIGDLEQQIIVLVHAKGLFIDEAGKLQSVNIPMFVEVDGIRSVIFNSAIGQNATVDQYLEAIRMEYPAGTGMNVTVAPNLAALSAFEEIADPVQTWTFDRLEPLYTTNSGNKFSKFFASDTGLGNSDSWMMPPPIVFSPRAERVSFDV